MKTSIYDVQPMPQLLIIRHGEAQERPSVSQKIFLSDEKRPLTEGGKSEVQDIAQILPNLVKPTRFISSQLKRAMETMEIVIREFGATKFEKWKELSPSSHPVEFIEEWGRSLKEPNETLAMAGHEPHLSTLLSFLLSGSNRSFVKLPTGGAALVKFNNGIQAGAATLQWYMTPNQLRMISK